MVLGDSAESKSFDCTLAENRTDSSAELWEVPWEKAEEELEETFRDLLENRGTFPVDTLAGVETPVEFEGGTAVDERVEQSAEDFHEVVDSSRPKDFANSRK